MRLSRGPVSPLDDERIFAVRPAVLGWRKLAREYFDSAHLLFSNERYRDSVPLFRKSLEAAVRAVQALEGEPDASYERVEEDFFKRFSASSLLTRIDLKEAGATFISLITDTEREPLAVTSEQIRSLDKAVRHFSTFFERADKYIAMCLTTRFYRTWRRRIATIILLAIFGGTSAGFLWHIMVNLGSGAKATYFSDPTFLNEVTTRIDPAIDFDFNRHSRPPGVPRNNFAVRWQAFVYAPTSGEYGFLLRVDDGARLSIGGKKLIDNWDRQTQPEERATVVLERGWHALEMEYFQDQGAAIARLLWKRPDRKFVTLEGPYLKVEPR